MLLINKCSLLAPVLALGTTACFWGAADSTSPPGSLNLLAPSVGGLSDKKHYPVTFTWGRSSGATSYTLCRKNDAYFNNCESLGSTTELSLTLGLGGPLKNLLTDFFVLATNSGGSTASNTKSLTTQDLNTLISYIKASNTQTLDRFASSVSLSGDGNTVAVGARNEDSNATGINGDGSNDDDSAAGAVYVYRYADDSWSQQAYVKASNTGAGDLFGFSVSLSDDGNTLAVGAGWEDSNSTGINQDGSNDGAIDSGAAYVFRFSSGSWGEQAYIKASNTGGSDLFGASVSLSGDGNTLAVGAYAEDSDATGINGDGSNDNRSNTGAVYVYRFSGSSWSQQAYIKASNAGAEDYFGSPVTLSKNGSTLAVGADGEDSNATGINGDGSNDGASGAGAAYVYRFASGSWSEQAYIKASNTGGSDKFGYPVSLSDDGNTLAVGARGEDSNTTGINGDGSNDGASNAGAAYLYRFVNASWSEQAYIKASNTGSDDTFGHSLSVSGDGNTLAVGARWEDSDATGVKGDDSNDSASNAGAVYVYRFADANWSEQVYIKASNTGSDDYFGRAAAVSLSADGNTLAVGADEEDSIATGINGDGSDDSASGAGAVFIY
ncbi:hypothetical protein [Enterovibrio norvegicus]|uniref:hypothetical protein n=1 Tax=Enterovibrio norvegicus TaxID=188144 RepID=UPI000C844204|nr:hypothetical protein [Enterovibrio norvegicus]